MPANGDSVWRWLGNAAGFACVGLTLVLAFPPGVRAVRADPGEAALMSVDPLLEAQPAPAAPAPPAGPRVVGPAEADQAERPGLAGIEVQPGIVVLNTRGYNYGPPPQELESEALEHEPAPR